MLASLNGYQITNGAITIPFSGIWHADLDVEGPAIAGRVTVKVGGLTLAGTVFRAGEFAGNTLFRVVGGAGGWQTIVPSQTYTSNSSVRLSLVVNDAARITGETISLDTDRELGTFYVRQRAPAARVLNQLTALWWMRNDGVTVIGARSVSSVTSQFDVLTGTDLGLGRVILASDKPEDFVPGKTIRSTTLPTTQTIAGVVHRIDKTKLRTEIWVR